MTNATEDKFKKFCKKRNWYCKKFLTHTATGFGNKQESDFLVSNNKAVWFVEVKERHSNIFNFKDLTQSKELKIATKKKSIFKILIVFNFPLLNEIVVLTFKEFINLKENVFFKNGKLRESFNINDINIKYKTNWKELNKFF